MDFDDHVVLVTGASRGIGAAIARAFAAEGAAVAVNYLRSEAAAEAVTAECKKLGGDASAFRADVTDGAAITAMVDGVVETFGKIDVVVNNAFHPYTFDADNTSSPTWDYHGHLFNFGVTAPPWKTLRIDASFDYYLQNYLNDNEFSPTLVERKDDILNTTLTITKPIGSSYSVGLQYMYTRNQSNVSVFDYNRSVFALMASGQF